MKPGKSVKIIIGIKREKTMINRDVSLDLLKTISMILVIVIHLSNYYCRNASDMQTTNFIVSVIYDGLSRICVPLFFMVSGVVILNGKYDGRKYARRIIKFIYILAFWSIVYYLWDAFYMKYEYDIVEDFFNVFFTPNKVHLWFMYPIIGLYIIAPFIQKMVNGMDKKLENLFLFLWIGFSGGVYIFSLLVEKLDVIINIVYPLPMIQETYWLGYFVAGYILYKRLQKLKGETRYNLLLVVSFIASMFITIGLTLYYSIVDGVFYEEYYVYRSLFIVIATLSFFSYVIINSARILKRSVEKAAATLVTYSFGVYLSHLMFYNILVKEFDVLRLNGAYAVPVFTVLIFLVSLSFTYVLKKIPILKNVV